MEVVIKNITVAAFATVGLIEVLKNFLPKNLPTWVYSVIMIPVAVACYFAVVNLPAWVIGGILTISVTQLCYQTIVQTFKAIVERVGKKSESQGE